MDPIPFAAIHDFDFCIERTEQILSESMQYCHYHNTYEIYYLSKGEKYYFIKDKCYKLKKGSLAFINRYDIHYTTAASGQECERYLITFKKEFLDSLANSLQVHWMDCLDQEIHVIDFNPLEQPLIESLLCSMLTEYQTALPGYEAYLKSALLQLFIIINRYSNQTTEEHLGYMNTTHKIVSESISYINDNFSEAISLRSISQKFFLSSCYFSKIFKKSTGLTFTDYLNRVRIKEAQTLLHRTTMNINDIAEAVGFNSTTHFDRIFKKHMGMSPLAYKKNIKL